MVSLTIIANTEIEDTPIEVASRYKIENIRVEVTKEEININFQLEFVFTDSYTSKKDMSIKCVRNAYGCRYRESDSPYRPLYSLSSIPKELKHYTKLKYWI